MLQCPRFQHVEITYNSPGRWPGFSLGKETALARVMHQGRKPGDVSPGRNGPDDGLGAAPEPSPYTRPNPSAKSTLREKVADGPSNFVVPRTLVWYFR